MSQFKPSVHLFVAFAAVLSAVSMSIKAAEPMAAPTLHATPVWQTPAFARTALAAWTSSESTTKPVANNVSNQTFVLRSHVDHGIHPAVAKITKPIATPLALRAADEEAY